MNEWIVTWRYGDKTFTATVSANDYAGALETARLCALYDFDKNLAVNARKADE